MAFNLKYRIGRAINGESGIVMTVKSAPVLDDFGNLPQLVRFRNPLGQLITEISPVKELVVVIPEGILNKHPVREYVYKSYKAGDKFP